MKKAGSVVGVILFAAVMAFALSGWVKGHVFGLIFQWFGNDSFMCGGSQVVSISGKTLELDDTIITAGGDCEITLTDCHFKSPEPVSVGGNASVIIEGGTLEAGKTAVSFGGSPKRFVAKGVTIKSKGDGVRLYGKTLEAVIEGGSIQADKTALIATYDAKARVEGTRLEGGEAAVRAERNAAVTLDASVTVEGKIQQARGGTVSGP